MRLPAAVFETGWVEGETSLGERGLGLRFARVRHDARQRRLQVTLLGVETGAGERVLSQEPRRAQGSAGRAVQTEITNGARDESQGDYQAVTVRGHRPNHILHLILTIITGGVWGLLVWLPIAIFGGEKRRMVTVEEFGKHRRAEGVTTPPLKRAAGPDLV